MLYTRERDLVLNSCLKLSTSSEERESEGGSAFQEEVFMEEVELQCKYWTCNFRCVSKADMTDHISKKHVIDEVFVCFNQQKKQSFQTVFKCSLSIITLQCTCLQSTFTVLTVNTARRTFQVMMDIFTLTWRCARLPMMVTPSALVNSQL